MSKKVQSIAIGPVWERLFGRENIRLVPFLQIKQKIKEEFKCNTFITGNKALKTLGTVITVFIACWLFFFYRYTFCGFDVLCPKDFKEMKRLEDIAFLIGYFNSAINPVLYSFTNKDFRKAFKKMLKFDRPKAYTTVRRNSRLMVRL